MMIIPILVFALLAFAWSILILVDCCSRRSDVIAPMYRGALENRQVRYTVVLVIAALLIGLSLDKLLP